MKNLYKRWAIFLVICLVVGLFSHMNRSFAGSELRVRLVITDMYVTHKTYPLDKGRHRQLQVKLDNAFGNISLKFKSSNKKRVGVTKKGYIEARKLGTAKIRVTVTCKSGKKKVTKKTWVKIRVRKVQDPTATDMPYDTNVPIIITSSTPTPTKTPPSATGLMLATLIVNGPEPAQFNMTILDTGNGRALYNSLPRVFYFEDRDKNTKTATEENYESGYTRDDEFKPGSLDAGDFMLYGVDRYELIYKAHKTGFAYTRLGKIQNPSGLETALGSGAVSVTLIKSVLPTDSPSSSSVPGGSPGVTPPVSVTPTPAVTLAPGVTVSPRVTVTPVASLAPGQTTQPPNTAPPAPGTSTSPASGASPGVITATPAPTAYTGNGINVTINGQTLTFVPNTSSSVATQFYNELKAGTQQYTLIKDATYENRAYAPLTKTYTETTAPRPERWAAGDLVLMGNNEINIYIKTTANNTGAVSTLLGTLDRNGLPAGRGVSEILADTYFGVPSVAAQFSAQ